MTIEEIEGYFTGVELPESATIDTGVVIEDIPLFLRSHFSFIRENPGKKSTEVYFDRLQRLIAIMDAKTNNES
ncbi:DUF6965 family protein [Pedobacter duraquae]|uniref:DUF6965 domain-containing protein n=1 Tax=Pedobacter duraquae TaxID=425511 RepID=A0A4R6IQW0_9SPHI|nr:hypothetical protein [Pedobacter duraquae]TDO24770.1 hypothetical protein CLV32_1063 [Pedobacter duraquae]